MPDPVPDPATGDEFTNNVPNCATLYIFELNGLHYYETVDCASGDTGWGVSPSLLTGSLGCSGGTCPPGNVVDPAFVRLTSSQESSFSAVANVEQLAELDESSLLFIQDILATALQNQFPSGLARKRRAKKEIEGFLSRHAGGNGDIGSRRLIGLKRTLII